jgi:hypothetical protein
MVVVGSAPNIWVISMNRPGKCCLPLLNLKEDTLVLFMHPRYATPTQQTMPSQA